MNGCDAGNIFTPTISLGEDWIITADKGAIAYSAHSDVGIRTQLKIFSDYFLETGFGDSAYINKSLGEIMLETDRRYLARYNPLSEIYIAQVQQTILQGDPAYNLFSANKADYFINDDQVFSETSTGDPITSVTDSFDIAVIVSNFGIVNTDSLEISIRRNYPNSGTQSDEEILGPYNIGPVFYKDTIRITVFNNRIPFTGENIFEITIDPENRIPELSDMNNTATFILDIPALGTNNLFPYDYAIVNTDTFSLIAQSSYISDTTKLFVYELDTVPSFNSLIKKEFSLPQKWLADWLTGLPESISGNDSTVFFWRTRFSETLPGEENIWSQSSFTYIPQGPEGWAQATDHQILENKISGMSYNQSERKWEFEQFPNRLEVITYGSDHPEFGFQDVSVSYNGNELIIDPLFCTENSINALAFRRISALPYLVFDYNVLNRRSCGRQPQLINNFLNSEIEGSADYNLSLYIDQLPTGDPVLVYSIGQVSFTSWSANLLNKLAEIGVSSTQMENLSDGEPLIILGKKGSPVGSATVIRGNPASSTSLTEQTVSLQSDIYRTNTSGNISSVSIGPAISWSSLYHRVSAIDNPDEDIYSISVYGVRSDNSTEELYADIQTPFFDLSSINPNEFSYVYLVFYTEDKVSLSPAHLDQWIVSYTPPAEGVLLPADDQAVQNIMKQEGEPFEAGFIFRNIGKNSFNRDSLLSSFSLLNQTTFKFEPDSVYIQSPGPGQTTEFKIDITTIGYIGKNDFTLQVNPGILPEINYRNNSLRLIDFAEIRGDLIRPIIDVAFDGRYILDGEIVSPSPLISIVLKDENNYILKQDTTGIDILLTYPENEFPTRVAFSDPSLTWTPASDNNDFKIEYMPESLSDGIYRLEVKATDASGNESGTDPYEIHFEVVNESQITHFYPFPNPFSTSTRFVFTLTGSVIPEEIKIQIMTVSGRVVREIMQDEIGPIHIGNNITEYAWDGRDEYGDQLANGVYLYRVIINNPGESFQHRESGGDAGFTKDFGKIYLLR
jgi:hypothetical protein